MKIARYIYFMKPIGMEGPIKIGCSDAPLRRLEQLSVWSPWPLEILATSAGGFSMERNLHECFFDAHFHREWFNAVPSLVDGILAVAGGASLEAAFDLTARRGSLRSKYNRKPWPEERRVWMSWQIRIRGAERRAKKARGEQMWVPESVWGVAKRLAASEAVPEDQVAQANQVIAEASERCLNRDQRWPKKVAA